MSIFLKSYRTTGMLPGLEEFMFEATFESLSKHTCPDWFRDAKFGKMPTEYANALEITF